MNTMLVPIADIIAEIANNIFVCLYFVYDYYLFEKQWDHPKSQSNKIGGRNSWRIVPSNARFRHAISTSAGGQMIAHLPVSIGSVPVSSEILCA